MKWSRCKYCLQVIREVNGWWQGTDDDPLCSLSTVDAFHDCTDGLILIPL